MTTTTETATRRYQPNDPPVGEHVLDRLILHILDEESSDLLGAPDWVAIAREAAPRIRDAIRRRKERGQSVEGQLAYVDSLTAAALEALCLRRVRVCCS